MGRQRHHHQNRCAARQRDIQRAIEILKSTVEPTPSLCTPGASRSEIIALVARLESTGKATAPVYADGTYWQTYAEDHTGGA